MSFANSEVLLERVPSSCCGWPIDIGILRFLRLAHAGPDFALLGGVEFPTQKEHEFEDADFIRGSVNGVAGVVESEEDELAAGKDLGIVPDALVGTL